MRDFNIKEYQTVILGALLHDIGKFLNRGADVKRKHPYFSADYVSSEQFKSIIKEEWIDIKLLKILVQCHHEHPLMPDDLLVQKIENPHIRKLAYIISRADSYSSGERIDEEPAELDYKQVRLTSIFSKITKNTDTSPPIKYYRLHKLSPEAVFPVEESDLYQLTFNYDQLLEDFGKAFKLFKPKDFNALFNGYLSIFEEFLWCVPSDTREKYNDISLYDHLLTTSAIAACLYHYHYDDFNEDSITNDSIEKCMLVGGDLFGIQSFIFEIGSTNPKKLSKILRGRSFYLSLLTEMVSFKILKSLNLPVSCRIMNAGGRFVLLVPNRSDVKDKINIIRKEIESWFYKTFLGKISLNLEWGITLKRDDFSAERFAQKQKELSYRLEHAKKRRFNEIIFDDIRDNAMHAAYSLLHKNEQCDFCKVFPALEKGSRCKICTDSEFLGENLISKPYIFFYDNDKPNSIKILDYIITFENFDNNWLMMEYYGNEDEIENPGFIKRQIANYIPEKHEGDIDVINEKPETGNSLCRYCGSPCKIEDDKSEKIPPRERLIKYHLTFQCMSASTRRNNNGKGVDHLGIIKADVDDLGFIFSYGLGEKLTISRYATLSRMLNYFFTAWLKDEIKKNYRMTYTVYAGGDDLCLIAPWEEAINLGIKINKCFHDYVANNLDLTISMGINLMRPNSPVRISVEVAEEYLEKSKAKNGKNAITIFNTTVKWEDIEELISFKNILDKEFKKDETGINASFLYRLLKYHEMYKDYSENGIIEGLRFHSLMTRDIRRNVEKKNPEIVKYMQPLYVVGDGFNEKLMNNIKIPVFWTLYKNRGGTK